MNISVQVGNYNMSDHDSNASETINTHFVNGRALEQDFPEGALSILLGMGCFWGVEQKLWQQAGVWVTSAGYAGGQSDNPDYKSVCQGDTGHAEVVRVIYQPEIVSTDQLLALFWESHDPTQGMRQGNDIGEQYRSAIYCSNQQQLELALSSRDMYQKQLNASRFGTITTEIKILQEYHLAEGYHQQYLAKNPDGYCGLKGTGVSCML